MPRKRRITITGEVHHVMSRGLDGKEIFRDDEDRERFLSICGTALTEGGCLCYAWVLMPNHFHLVLRPLNHSLQRIMRRINGNYARVFNRKYNRRGYLFQDRYRSLATQEFWYIREIIRYVHLNPLRAGLVDNVDSLAAYPWSGHAGFLGSHARSWHSVTEALSKFGRSIQEARISYLKWISKNECNKNEGWYPHIQGNVKNNDCFQDSRIAGDAEFVRKAIARERSSTARILTKRLEKSSLDDLIQAVADEYKLSQSQIVEKHRWSPGKEAKAVFCRRAVQELGYTHTAVADFLQINASSVNRLIWAKNGS